MAKRSIEPGQLCLGCGSKPATSINGTVPLCAECAALAKEAKRGVKFEKTSSVNHPG
jgi:hypothetical protein